MPNFHSALAPNASIMACSRSIPASPGVFPGLLHVGEIAQPLRTFVAIKSKNEIDRVPLGSGQAAWVSADRV
jgi:hypothetical protein